MSKRLSIGRHTPRRGVISCTEEREFERESRKLESLEEETKKIYKDARKCIEHQTAQTKCECKLYQDLLNSSVCKDEERLRGIIEQCCHTAQNMETLAHELTSTEAKAIIEPMKKFSTVFPNVLTLRKKREQALEEYNKCQARVDKYSEKERTGPNIVKMNQAKRDLENAKKEYEMQNRALMEELPQLLEFRHDYLEPSFQALVRAQVKYYSDAHKHYSELIGNMLTSPFSEDDITIREQELNEQTASKLASIKALSITGEG